MANPYTAASPPPPGINIPIDAQYMLHNTPPMAYALPPSYSTDSGACSPAAPNYGVSMFPPVSPPV
ncbi:hypothetical protein BT96DRAFT_1001227 [Gymnopus androsaceus JB14]|uniref:Uncharacterized protein n=1 Tax=Gymnopus androsaceus JB14 TaxID=1447944 RepID=A0A6A4H1D7_9AGAR|nr:hypothetical protein BT96DRAFT_1001227 [Gymnopus androsaceus JB14]